MRRARRYWVAALAALGLAAPVAHLPTFAAAQSTLLEAPDPEQPVALVADSVRYDTTTQELTAAGNVEVYYGDRTLTAERIVYNAATDRIRAEGRITITNPDGSIITADAAELDATLTNALIQGARLALPGDAKFAAVEGQRIDGRYNVLDKAVFSPCVVCIDKPVPLWRIRARRIVHDEVDKVVHYEDATFDVLGTSIAWLPYFRHPDPTVNRATGLLIPEFSSSSTYGYALKQPYFWVLGDHADLTLTPFMTTEDGLILEGEYRRAFSNGNLEIGGSISEDDYDGQPGVRGHLFVDGLWDLGDGYEAGLTIRQASDDGYLRRYDFTDQDRLTSEIFVRHSDADGFAEASLIRFQSLRDDERAGQIPLAHPSIDAARDWSNAFLGGDVGATFNAYSLSRVRGEDTARLSVGVNWERVMRLQSGVQLRGFAEARGDVWSSRGDPAFDDAVTTRFAPLAGVEARLPLVRVDETATHVIEPIVQAIVAPSILDGDTGPNEDSLIVEFDETNLFDTRRHPGQDGFEDGPRLNLGLRYDRLSVDGFNFSTSFGRTFRLEDIDSFSSEAGLNTRESDYVGAWSFSYAPYFSISNRLRVADDFAINRNEVRASAKWRGFDVTGAYIFLESDATAGAVADREEAFLRGKYAISDNWTVGADLRRDMESSQWIRTGASLTYSNECVDVDLYAGRRFTSSEDVPASTNFGVRVRLWALGGRRDATTARARMRAKMSGRSWGMTMTKQLKAMAMSALCAVTLAALLLTTPAAAQQNQFKPAAYVNSHIITYYDVGQRQRVLVLNGAPNGPGLSRAALETLIEDKVKLDAARDAGIIPNDASTQDAVRQYAERRNLDDAKLASAIRRAGVSRSSLEEWITADAMWNTLIRRRFASRAEPTETALDERISALDLDKKVEYNLGEISMPFAGKEGEVMTTADLISQQVNAGGDFKALAREHSRAPSRQRGGAVGWVPRGRMPPNVLEQVAALEPGGATEPIRVPGGVIVLGLFDKREEPIEITPERRDELRRQVADQEIGRLAEGYLQDLKNRAYIEVR